MELDQILNKLNVSRETLSTLNKYRELVISENLKINLISAKTAIYFGLAAYWFLIIFGSFFNI